MTEVLRAEMGKAAIDSAKAIKYEGAGTVEFLLDTDDSFYFMEMNTRLQVEHPVSEMISGQDLVEWQLLVASGEPLPLTQEQLKINGHSFEARVYAESPDNDFLPATGTLQYLKTPDQSANVRVDTGVMQGDEVSVYYDPMIAKLIVWDRDRDSALRQMKSALLNYKIMGVNTNLEFLSTLFSVPDFANADFDTGFIEKNEAYLFPQRESIPRDVVALISLYQMLHENNKADTARLETNDPHSLWGSNVGWQLNLDSKHTLEIVSAELVIPVRVGFDQDSYRLQFEDDESSISGQMVGENELTAKLDGRKLTAVFTRNNLDITVLFEGRVWNVTLNDHRQNSMEDESAAGGLVAPMPSSVVAIEVSVGDMVKKGDALIIVEAMKMEHTIVAPTDGKVKDVFFAVGDQVEDGEELLSLDSD